MRSASASAELPLRGGGGQHDGGAQRPAAAPEAPEHGGKGEEGDAGGLPHGLVIEGSATLALAIREPVIAPVIAALFGINRPLGVEVETEVALAALAVAEKLADSAETEEAETRMVDIVRYLLQAQAIGGFDDETRWVRTMMDKLFNIYDKLRQPAALAVDKGESTTEELIVLMTREVQLIDAATHTFMWRLHVQAARLRAEHAHDLARCRRDLPRYSEPKLLANLARVIGQQLQHFEEGMPVESAEWSSARALCIELDTGKTWQKWQQQMERPEKEAREKEAKEAAEKARMLESFADAPDWSDEEEEEEESESGSAAIEPQHTAVDSQLLATAANTSRHPVPAEQGVAGAGSERAGYADPKGEDSQEVHPSGGRDDPDAVQPTRGWSLPSFLLRTAASHLFKVALPAVAAAEEAAATIDDEALRLACEAADSEESPARVGPMTRGEGGWPSHEARERRQFLEDQRDSRQRLRDEATTAPLEFNDDEKLTCRNDHEIASYCQPTVRNFACDSCPEFLIAPDGELIETPRPPAGMLMLGCRTCDEDFCMQCVLEMPLLTMLDPPDEPPLQQKKKKEKDAKKTNPPAAAEPEPQPIEPEPPPAAPDPPGKTPAQAAAKSLKRARQKARKRAALATATSGAVT